MFVSHLQRLAWNGDPSSVAMEEFSVVGGRVQIGDRSPNIRIRYVNCCSPDLSAPRPLMHKNDPVSHLIEIPRRQFANWQLLQEKHRALYSGAADEDMVTPGTIARVKPTMGLTESRRPAEY